MAPGRAHAHPVKFPPDPTGALLFSQRRAILRALQSPSLVEEGSPNDDALDLLQDLLAGSVEKGEGNSCLVLGPRSSGKTRLVHRALLSLNGEAIVVRLSGHIHVTDKAAVREMLRQVAEQTGDCMSVADEDEPDSDPDEELDETMGVDELQLPPPSHILAAVSSLTKLARPVVIVLEAFDLFAAHARQALLYCLFDAAQNCHASDGLRGLAIVGVTSRVDTVNLLEKRVKSRFSHRLVRTSSPKCVDDFMDVARTILSASLSEDFEFSREWNTAWAAEVNRFLTNPKVKNALSNTFALVRDVRLLCRALTRTVLRLTPSAPQLQPAHLLANLECQRAPSRHPFLTSLTYPALGLLIAASHCRSAGHDVFTFEMLFERFDTQIRASSSAPVQLGGVSIGMLKCSRDVMLCAFEHLIATCVFQSAAVQSSNTAKEFIRVFCVPDREEIQSAVGQTAQTSLRKWFSKGE